MNGDAVLPQTAAPREHARWSGYVLALSGAVLFGVNASLAKVVLASGLTAGQLTLARTLGTAIVAAAVLAVWKPRLMRVTGRDMVGLALLGVAGVGLMQWLFATAISLLPVGIALLIQYCAVVVVALVAMTIFKERVHPRLWLAIAIVLTGLSVVATIWNTSLNGWGMLAASGAALTYALYFLLGERSVAHLPPLTVTLWSGLWAAGLWAALSGWWRLDPSGLTQATPLRGALESVSVPMWAALSWVVLMGSFAPFFLLFLALKRLPATTVGILATSEVVFAFAIAWWWLGEAMTPIQIVGAGMVCVGIIVAQTARQRKVALVPA